MKAGPTTIWTMLVGATAASWLLAEDAPDTAAASTLIVLIATFKANFVISHFMELGWKPRPFRLVASVWLAGATATILAGYWI